MNMEHFNIQFHNGRVFSPYNPPSEKELLSGVGEFQRKFNEYCYRHGMNPNPTEFYITIDSVIATLVQANQYKVYADIFRGGMDEFQKEVIFGFWILRTKPITCLSGLNPSINEEFIAECLLDATTKYRNEKGEFKEFSDDVKRDLFVSLVTYRINSFDELRLYLMSCR